MEKKILQQLLQKKRKGSLTDKEQEQLSSWESSLDREEGLLELHTPEEQTQLQQRMWEQIEGVTHSSGKLIHINLPEKKKGWRPVAAAASVLILLGISGYLFSLHHLHGETAKTQGSVQPLKNDVAPGGNRAVLILGNGSAIQLDSARNGLLTKQGNANITKLTSGQLAYNILNEKPTEILFNTLTTPRGGQYQLTLPDGSRVWLNAASSIRFPSSFAGNERKVRISGEVYFEVAKDAARPFRVDVQTDAGDAEQIEVLGTHFNVNAYSEEPGVKTTLLEGSVKIKKANASQMLSPGQQASLTKNGITLEQDVNLSKVVAWKNGFFWFDHTDLQTLMRQVARWYDVDVQFEGQIPEESFTGKISRSEPLSRFMKVLELNDVHIKTEGKRITVMP